MVSLTAAQVTADYAAAFSRRAETVMVRRYSGAPGSRVPTDTPGRARVVGFQPAELIAGIVQGDRRVVLLVDAAIAALLPLTTADKIVVRNKECQLKAIDNNTRRMGDNLFALDLVVAA